jgi:hypothetical protein
MDWEGSGTVRGLLHLGLGKKTLNQSLGLGGLLLVFGSRDMGQEHLIPGPPLSGDIPPPDRLAQ